MKKLIIIFAVLFFLSAVAGPIFAEDSTLKCNHIIFELEHRTLEVKLRMEADPEAMLDENGLERCPTINEIHKRITELFPDYFITDFTEFSDK